MKTGEDNTFTAKLTGQDGKPVEGAEVKVALVMPAMPSMGMPEMKSSFDLRWDAGKHAYIGKGQPGMAGTWSIAVEASKGGKIIAISRTHKSAQ